MPEPGFLTADQWLDGGTKPDPRIVLAGLCELLARQLGQATLNG